MTDQGHNTTLESAPSTGPHAGGQTRWTRLKQTFSRAASVVKETVLDRHFALATVPGAAVGIAAAYAGVDPFLAALGGISSAVVGGAAVGAAAGVAAVGAAAAGATVGSGTFAAVGGGIVAVAAANLVGEVVRYKAWEERKSPKEADHMVRKTRRSILAGAVLSAMLALPGASDYYDEYQIETPPETNVVPAKPVVSAHDNAAQLSA